MKRMFEILSEKPIIGASAGVGSGMLYSITTFLTDESILKIVSAFGIWMGFIIAILTGLIKLMEVFKMARKKS